jgi:RNA polymerase sigma factor (sigma-70 family)
LDALEATTSRTQRFDLSDDDVDALVSNAGVSRRGGHLEQLSALSAFQRLAEQYRALSADEQAGAIRLIRGAEQAATALRAGNLKGKERAAAEELVRRAPGAKEHLAASVWRLAWLIVRESASRRHGIERANDMLPDLMAEANVAVAEAIATFRPGAGPSFATYTSRLVRDRLRSVLSKGDTTGLPPSWLRLKRIWVMRAPELADLLGRNPTVEEIQTDLTRICNEWARRRLSAEQLLLPDAQQAVLMEERLRKQGMLGAIRDIEEVMRATQSVASLDAPVGGDGETRLLDVLGPARGDDVTFDAVELGELTQALNDAMSELTDRERTILLMRFGFVDHKQFTYQEISERFGVTAERIRQIEKSTLSRLRDPNGPFTNLASFLPSYDGD